MSLGIDRWIYPVTIDSSNQDLVLFEDDGAGNTAEATLTIPTGTYWCLLKPIPAGVTIPSPLTSLYEEILSEITSARNSGNLVSTGTYNIARIDPSSSDNTFGKKSGLRFEYTGTDLSSFELRFGSSSHTFPPEVFGFLDTRTTNATSSSLQIDGPHTCWGTWTSVRIGRKTAGVQYEEELDEASYSRFTHVSWQRKVIRDFRYFNLPGVHVYRGRATRDKYASVGDLAKNDQNNCWEDVWARMRDGSEAIIIHDSGDTFEDINGSADNYELCRVFADSERGDFKSTLNEEDRQAEFYTVEMSLRANPDHSPYTY